MKRIDIAPATIKAILLDYESGIRGQTLATKYHFSPGKLYKTMREIGHTVRPASRRKHLIDENMFETIDNELKAYLLGMFYADGGIRPLNVTLRLHEKDKCLMETLTQKLKCPLFYTSGKTYTYPTYSRKCNPQYYFNLNSKKLVGDLIHLGCGLRKSLTLQFPSYEIVPKPLFHHFLRGYFDGDGCIQHRTFHIISSDDFCIGFQRWLINELKVSSYLRKHEKVSRVMVHKHKDIMLIAETLYQDATLFLPRKRDEFIEFGYLQVKQILDLAN